MFLGLLPSYLEQGNSSLDFMVDYLIQNQIRKESGFYFNNYKKLYDLILNLKSRKKNNTYWSKLCFTRFHRKIILVKLKI